MRTGGQSYPFGSLRTIQWPEGTGSLVGRTMSYDPAGNVTSLSNWNTGENIAYGYDDHDRLTSAGSPINEAYTYNEIGNMTSKGGQSLSYNTTGFPPDTPPARPHAATSYGGATYEYDSNGSMVARSSGQGKAVIRYDGSRRPVRVGRGINPIWRAAYDADGVRRKRVDERGTVHYLGGYERNAGNGLDTTKIHTTQILLRRT